MTVSLVSPSDGAQFASFTPMTLSATTSGGDVSSVAFYVNGALIGTATSSPYGINWPGAADGTYQVSAVASSTAGQLTTSSVATVVVAPLPWTLPGRRC